MLGLRLAPKEDLDVAPAELVLSQLLCIPGEFLPESSATRSSPFLSAGALTLGPINHCSTVVCANRAHVSSFSFCAA